MTLLTPAQKAAGPEDAAVRALALFSVEELLRAALLGQRGLLLLHFVRRLRLGHGSLLDSLGTLVLRGGGLHLRLISDLEVFGLRLFGLGGERSTPFRPDHLGRLLIRRRPHFPDVGLLFCGLDDLE